MPPTRNLSATPFTLATMDHDALAHLRRHSAAWRLLASDNAALVLAFLGGVFIDDNVREIGETDLVIRLADFLADVNEGRDEPLYPRQAKAYLTDWADPERGWVRKYYPPGSDEAHFDASSDVELAVAWVRDLGPREFIGTESRLGTILELLRQMVHGAETDPEARREELQRRRAEIDAELDRLDQGQFDVMSPVAQRERYQQLGQMARELLADFRAVEENFRSLDRDLRARIAGWTGTKAGLLDELLGSRDLIDESPQGQSFAAFFEFLLSPQRRAEFTDLLTEATALDAVDPDQRLRYIHHDWQTAGERTQSTVRQLSEQLSGFLDDQAWLEHGRIMELLGSIRSKAVEIRNEPTAIEMDLDVPRVDIVLPIERPLYQPARQIRLDSALVDEVDAEQIAAVDLIDDSFVDTRELIAIVNRSLGGHAQVALSDVLAEAPLTRGLAELVSYLSLTDPGFAATFDEQEREALLVDEQDHRSLVRMAKAGFARRGAEEQETR